ncbi:Dihydroorotate dehydrogenase electron transfer subunit [Bathymodiolus heckerae thiotrophic gill symbiont]|uniref:dihydroorotate dehydrogenase electron transfer subunit n=1 Tax=Bathymodiolus heckerae thiotrophic gill symbiont TaxID=1052212 RepID=UPI0010B5121A|nr:dihydroorotate dehydrogenase electron transfer subunit [Bathymodiolus heckerae thiotrophic gill symbiont]CAC9535426.1 Dihydroorotate dehydrogenase (NAD(+)), electron transfer subunit (EC 1.3.1.14) [uncultured Gammaproteobacteria bacterium]CAC9953349.1 Dihydroorotate dehydrogenase (NAD(+)), electron transfer subunit (EC 1.3.1.14) [uncultured Gammaproteobacteria bacterium]SHN92830.1 Dihydroorotate dehydrogenase electron transfer subunit [Bathymodiolus heckerae thiotrophic gill symbiont]
MNKENRNTIKVVDCQVLAHYKFEGDQYILTLASKVIAQETKPGQFVHISVSDILPMRRPISIMSVDKENNTFDLLYKVVGEGTKQLAKRKIGEMISIIGPIGNGFKMTDKKLPLLIGGGVGMPPMIAIAQSIKDTDYDPFVILGSEVPFPFTPELSKMGNPCPEASHTMPELEDWGVACRLASLQDYEGVFKGYVTDLAKVYLDSLSTDELAQVEIYSCGPHPMLEAVAKLAKDYNLPCQVSLEENMACAVGGCAGCVVEVQTNNGPAMKRVCVDGPVFDATTVF